MLGLWTLVPDLWSSPWPLILDLWSLLWSHSWWFALDPCPLAPFPSALVLDPCWRSCWQICYQDYGQNCSQNRAPNEHQIVDKIVNKIARGTKQNRSRNCWRNCPQNLPRNLPHAFFKGKSYLSGVVCRVLWEHFGYVFWGACRRHVGTILFFLACDFVNDFVFWGGRFCKQFRFLGRRISSTISFSEAEHFVNNFVLRGRGFC